jgi:hypothetical protein
MIGGLRSDLEIENSGDFRYAGEPDLIAAFDTLNPAHFNSHLQGNYASLQFRRPATRLHWGFRSNHLLRRSQAA